MKRIKVGVIGAGRIGKVHIENISVRIPVVEIVAVADTFVEEAKKVAEKFAIKSFMADYKEILNNREVAAVVICSPTNTHAQYIIESAEAGKHIFCEKPLDLSLKKIRTDLDTVAKSGVKLIV